MKIERQIIVNVSADKVWSVLGHKYDRVCEWASSVLESDGKPAIANGIDAPFSGRKCETTIGSFDEEIIDYNERDMILAYTAKGNKMPFFVKRLVNNWLVTPIGENQSRIDMRMEMGLLPFFNLIMAPIMKIQMGKVVDVVIEDLKHYVERDKAHLGKSNDDVGNL